MRKDQFKNIYRNVKEKQCIVNYENRLYLLDEKNLFYRQISDEELAYIVNNLIDEEYRDAVSPNIVDLVVRKLLIDEELTLKKEKLNCPNLLNVKNGVLDIKNLKLMKKDIEKYTFTYQINANYLYNKEIQMNKKDVFIEFIETAMENDKEKIKLLLSMIGYLLTDFQDARVMFFLIGKTATGKSVIAKLLIELIGKDYVSNLGLNDINGQFNLSMLSGSKLNISTETEVKPITNTGRLKAIISGDRVFADQKNKQAINFEPKCKLVQIGNQVPKLKNDEDKENAFRDRFIILKFNNSIEKEKRDTELFEKLLLELDFILTMAINSFKENVLDNNFMFVKPKESIEFEDDYFNSDSNRIETFINELCELGDETDYREYIDKLYESYLKYAIEKCWNNNITKNKFSKILEEIGKAKGIKKARYRNGKDNKYGFIGLKLLN